MAAISSRYARALVEVVLEQRIDADLARQQLNAIAEAVRESVDLRRVWESPAVPAEQKRAVLDGIVGQISAFKAIRNFIAVIIDHRRIPMLDEIARQFAVELDAQLGLLGGVMVRVGSTIYDGSVRGQLEKMKQELSTA